MTWRAANRPVLVTGFEPFDGDTVNPSWEVARALHGKTLGGARIEAVRLPCAFGTSLQVLDAALAPRRPAVVVALGQAGRAAISLERVALNVDDARIPDNAGAAPVDRPVVAGAPAAYFTRLPIKAMARALREAGHPVEVSQTAGTFVCNHVFYGLMHRLRRRPAVRAGFVHVPMLPGQAAARGMGGGMALDAMVDAVSLAVRCAVTCRQDLVASEGRLD